MGETARESVRQAEDLRGRVETGLRQFLVQEDPQLVGREDLRTLSEAIEALEVVIRRAEATVPASPA